MYHFHVNLFAAPPADSFAVTWEDAAAMLERLPRMIFEPDGSFVVSGERAGPSQRAGPSSAPVDNDARWQVDGHLFDFAGRLHRVELHGQCPPATFDEILTCVGWPQQRLLLELVRTGITVSEAEFRRQWASQQEA